MGFLHFVLTVLAAPFLCCRAFTSFRCSKNCALLHTALPHRSKYGKQRYLYRVELDEIGFPDINSELCDVYILEKKDLSEAAELALETFFKPTLDPNNFSGPSFIINTFTAVERKEAWLSNWLGFWNRGGKRLTNPSLQPSSDGLILVATPPSLLDKSVKSRTITNNLISVVEIGLEPANGLLSPPLKGLFAPDPVQLSSMQPYLSNLCVAGSYRRRGIGQYMCHICEHIAVTLWDRDMMYLHVETNNAPAKYMYEKIGYKPNDLLSRREKILNGLENVTYYSKALKLS
mmetsp:Transcript_1853/g.3216  ORF Transcript_1853/g.3216 Transcript_1853/m.3216 type:complete len:289 (+) Transcript_1853:110-976(+)